MEAVSWSWLRVEPLQIHLHIYFQDLEDIAHHFHRTEHHLYSCQATKFWLKVASRRSLATTNCYVVSWEAFCIAAPRTQNMHIRCSLQWVLCLDCSQLAAGVTGTKSHSPFLRMPANHSTFPGNGIFHANKLMEGFSLCHRHSLTIPSIPSGGKTHFRDQSQTETLKQSCRSWPRTTKGHHPS